MSDESMRELHDRAMEYATESGWDIEHHLLPVTIDGFRCVTDTKPEDLASLRHWAREVSIVVSSVSSVGFDGTVSLYSPERPSLVISRTDDGTPWALTTILIDHLGEVLAVVSTVGGGPVGPGVLVAGPEMETNPETLETVTAGVMAVLDAEEVAAGHR